MSHGTARVRGIRRIRRVAATVVAISALATGCGGDDGAEDSSAGEDEDGTSVSEAGDECVGEVVATFGDEEVTLDQAVAVDVGAPAAPGAAYTIYAADYEVSATDTVSGAVPGERDHLATLAITTFNAEGTPDPVVEGSTITWTSDFGVQTFSVVLTGGGTALGNTAGASGTVDVVSLDDTAICVDVDYTDDEKSLSGTISAEIAG